MAKRRRAIAKLIRPQPYDVIARDHLFNALDDLSKGPSIWVTGPPGAGKTTLLSSYLEARSLPNLWYQVDEGDRDVSSFFYFLSEAV